MRKKLNYDILIYLPSKLAVWCSHMPKLPNTPYKSKPECLGCTRYIMLKLRSTWYRRDFLSAPGEKTTLIHRFINTINFCTAHNHSGLISWKKWRNTEDHLLRQPLAKFVTNFELKYATKFSASLTKIQQIVQFCLQ